MVRYDSPTTEIIGGACEDYVCRSCLTKRGWAHQVWCEMPENKDPSCRDCRYCDLRTGGCLHPGKKKERRYVGNEKC